MMEQLALDMQRMLVDRRYCLPVVSQLNVASFSGRVEKSPTWLCEQHLGRLQCWTERRLWTKVNKGLRRDNRLCSLSVSRAWLGKSLSLHTSLSSNNTRKPNPAATIRSCTAEKEPSEDGTVTSESLLHSRVRSLALSLLLSTCLVSLPVMEQEPVPPHYFGVEGPVKAHHDALALLYNFVAVKPAAAGLVIMPPSELKNSYYLVRAGESVKESQGILYTNPVGKTSVDSGLSEKGKRQTIAAAKRLAEIGACEASCWIWPSMTQRAYQTAEIISAVNGLSYSLIVPEYSFLDARAVGAYEGGGLDAWEEIHSMDAVSPRARPPPTYDGTPHESVADVLVRLVQLMSILETQYFGETVVIVSPDSENLSILNAALLGLDLRSHMNLAFGPGEVRMVDLKANSATPL